MLATGFRLFAILVFAAPSAAYAHTGVGDTHGFIHGLMHPLTGIDHILAMVAVGLFAAHLGGRALWLVPASFVTVMAFAGVAGAAGIPIPFVETGIALSVIALGLMVAFEIELPVAAAMALVGFFAIFHGHAHGAELPENSSGLAYGVGFMMATASLHALGVGTGLFLGRLTEFGGEKITRISGCAISAAGVAILLKFI
jgi:urease accessory protein